MSESVASEFLTECKRCGSGTNTLYGSCEDPGNATLCNDCYEQESWRSVEDEQTLTKGDDDGV